MGMTSLLLGLGLVSLGFGVLSIVISFLQAQAFAGWIWGNFIVGAVLIAVALATGFDSLRERVASGEGRRVGKYGTSAVFSTVLGIAILGMLAWLSTRPELMRKWDWTEQKVHTLTSQTTDILKNLDRDVEVTALFREGDRPEVKDLLDRYAYASSRFKVQYADPNARPDLVEKLGVDKNDLSKGLVHVQIGAEKVDLADPDESSLTNALVKLTRKGEKKVYFLVGHDERPIEGKEGEEATGFSRAALALRNENYRTDKLLLAAVGDVPADADVVVVAGPRRPFAQHEIDALQRYLQRGGALMVLVDPRTKSDLDPTLAGWGAKVDDDVVIDPQMALFGSVMSPFGVDFDSSNPITKVLRADTPILFHLAQSVEPEDGAPGAKLKAIVRTSKDAWGERAVDEMQRTGRVSKGPDDVPGPVALVLAGEPNLPDKVAAADADPAADKEKAQKKTARLVVVGDSDFAANQYLDQVQNRDFFVNSVNWLLGDVQAISIRPHKARASRFHMSNEQYQAIQSLSLFVLPEGIAMLGVLAWWWRRREGAGVR